ncbi:23 kDa jasmonate-induced protein-like [Diospyros lotus]|uniref:23 kDa jasmonate-induced protein-like n=1 Tax=Diospyros lotus TaxID=55363 RepID=UPI002250F097|nr:23 kDa jasmonate-induced protein-like [Diospyros lotus]
MKNAQEKDFKARQHVELLKKEWGIGVSTLCLIYNATGDTITYITSHNHYGHLYGPEYTKEIANGQWGAFLHVKSTGEAVGSTAVVVYRGKNEAEQECDWLLGWSNPWDRASWDNMVYSEIKEAKHYDNGNLWGGIATEMYKCGQSKSVKWNGCLSYVSTGSYTSPIFEAIMTLKDADEDPIV